MTKEEAEASLKALEPRLRAMGLPPMEIRQCAGEWIAAPPGPGVVGVRLEGAEPIIFHGALGKWAPALGLPQSRERILGSSWRGRYQEFVNGYANWEVLRDAKGEVVKDVPNNGFPILLRGAPKVGEHTNAMVAFFDYRGFTTWSREAPADDVQAVVLSLELAFQDAFDQDNAGGKQVFAKGTGDGLMIVSEAAWYDVSNEAVQPDHALDFAQRCARTLDAGVRSLETQDLQGSLAIGCGITTGQVTRVYVLGRFDYLGATVNAASKLQGNARNEVCVDPATLALLRGRRPGLAATPIGEPGWSVNPGALAEDE